MNDPKTLIASAGGIRPLARKLGHAHHTRVQYWCDNNRFPADKEQEIRAAIAAVSNTTEEAA